MASVPDMPPVKRSVAMAQGLRRLQSPADERFRCSVSRTYATGLATSGCLADAHVGRASSRTAVHCLGWGDGRP